MRDSGSEKTMRPAKAPSQMQNFDLYKVHGINQFVLHYGGMEGNFVLEEDARRFAHKLAGVNPNIIIREVPRSI